MRFPQAKLARSALLAAAVVALAAPAASLASSNPIADSFVKTGKVKTVHSVVDLQMRAAAFPAPISIGMDVRANSATGEGEATIDMGDLLALFGGPKEKVKITLRLLKEKGSLVAYVGYGDSKLTAGALPKGKKWVRASAKDIPKTGNLDLGGLTQTSTPSEFAHFAEVVGKPTRVGSETVDGAGTTHYKATIDYAKLAKLHPELQKSLLGLAGSGVTTVPLDVWIDNAGLMRRLRMTITVRSSGQTATTTFTVTNSDFDEPVHVTAPPASETIDVSQLKTK